MLPMFGGLILVAFVVVALAVELSMLGGAYRGVAGAADVASESGAAMLDVAGVYDSEYELNPGRAQEEATRVAAAMTSSGASAEVAATELEVCVTVRDQYVPRTLVFLGLDAIDIAVTSCAQPRSG
jgi:hypothetical protein